MIELQDVSNPELRPFIANQWSSRGYKTDYFGPIVPPDEIHTIDFHVRASHDIPVGSTVLDFGCGPIPLRALTVEPYVDEIHMGDYLTSNLREIERWVKGKGEDRRWDSYVRYILECEGIISPTRKQISERKRATRSKIRKIFKVDASRQNPLLEDSRDKYPVVMSFYCADSVTSDIDEWRNFTRNIDSLAEEVLIMAALSQSHGYWLRNRYFPSPFVDSSLLRNALEVDFPTKCITIEEVAVPGHETQGYSSILLAKVT